MTLPGLPLPPRLHRELSLGFCLSPSSLLLSRQTGFIFIYPVLETKQNNYLPWKILIYIGKKNLYTPERHTKLCSPIPYGLNYPVIQESFFFCVDEAGVKGFSVFEMVYVNVAFIETSWDVIIVLLSTYKQRTAPVSPSPPGVEINANQLTQGNKPLAHTLVERFTYINRQTDKLVPMS